jgi:hypothetical protein
MAHWNEAMAKVETIHCKVGDLHLLPQLGFPFSLTPGSSAIWKAIVCSELNLGFQTVAAPASPLTNLRGHKKKPSLVRHRIRSSPGILSGLIADNQDINFGYWKMSIAGYKSRRELLKKVTRILMDVFLGASMLFK